VEIRIAAAALMREDGATLLVRKRGTSAFMQPGGKIDGDEAPISALCRELLEELGLVIQPEEAEYLGCFSSPAANETNCTVTAEIFRLVTEKDITVQSEIEEALWVYSATQDDLNLAPLTRNKVLPLIWHKNRR
jgi:8-oxo-dGTP diphosphatase